MNHGYGCQSMVDPIRRVVVRRPDDAFGGADPARWHYTSRPDLAVAQQEHDAFVEVLTQAGAEVISHLKKEKEEHIGYNARTDSYEDLFKAGVIDPTKVVRSALQNAASIASMVLTTEATVTDFDEEKDEKTEAIII